MIRWRTIDAVLLIVLSSSAAAQADSARYPLPGDVATLDGIIRAYYDVVSGPAGSTANRARDSSLHVEHARVGIVGRDADGAPVLRTMTVGEYHDRFGGPRRAPFYEWEIHRVTQRFGSVAHVWSTYLTSDAPDGSARSRGINSIQLYFDGTRWWITAWFFDSERDDNPIPAEFLPR